jgi:predicted Zn-dependent peptidase
VYNKAVLGNGLRVITNAMPHSHSVCLAILVGAGSCYESNDEAGISHFAEHLFFKGTRRRPSSKEITEAIEGVGGIINAGTDKEMTLFWCKVASPHFGVALDVLSDLLLNSRFDEKDMEQERRIITEEINMNLDIPQQRVNALIDELLWPDQPLGREVIGYKDTVSSITREKLLKHVARRYLPNNTVVSVAGNIEHEKVMAEVEPVFSDWAAGELVAGYTGGDNQAEPRLRIESKDIEQAHLCLAVHGFSHSHPRRFVLDLLSTVLGGGMSSRLFNEIRERRGLAYDIHSYTEHFLNSGSFAVYAGVDPGKAETTLTAILEELAGLKQGVAPDEVTRAKELSKGRLYLRLEDSRNVALWYGSQEMLLEQVLSPEDVVSIVEAITRDDLRDAAQEMLTDSGLNLAITGPVKDEKPLRQVLGIP